MKWYTLDLPTGQQAILPSDVPLEFLKDSKLTPHQLRSTAYIPWHDSYLEYVPKSYRNFFTFVLPYLGSRTTNVHTALSVSHVPFLISHAAEPVDERVVYLGTILHDTGWSKVSSRGISESLSYTTVAPTSKLSQLAKEQHVLMSVALAYDILDEYDFGDQPVFEATKRRITQAIRRHDYDASWNAGRWPRLSPETKLVCDADRLWSYTHYNFWQDTVRKGVRPEDYLLTISGAIDSYFITPQGKVRAHGLVADRRKEVQAYLAHISRQLAVNV